MHSKHNNALLPLTSGGLIAAFIDIDNFVHHCLEKNVEPDLHKLLVKLPRFSSAFSCGDIASLPIEAKKHKLRRMLSSMHVRHEDLPYTGRKNSADMRLAVAITAMVHESPKTDAYIIVSGDQDFIPVANYLRSQGKYVIGVGPSAKINEDYISACDHFFYMDHLLQDSKMTDLVETPDVTPISLNYPKIESDSDSNLDASSQAASVTTNNLVDAKDLPGNSMHEKIVHAILNTPFQPGLLSSDISAVARSFRFLYPDLIPLLKLSGGFQKFCKIHAASGNRIAIDIAPGGTLLLRVISS